MFPEAPADGLGRAPRMWLWEPKDLFCFWLSIWSSSGSNTISRFPQSRNQILKGLQEAEALPPGVQAGSSTLSPPSTATLPTQALLSASAHLPELCCFGASHAHRHVAVPWCDEPPAGCSGCCTGSHACPGPPSSSVLITVLVP